MTVTNGVGTAIDTSSRWHSGYKDEVISANYNDNIFPVKYCSLWNLKESQTPNSSIQKHGTKPNEGVWSIPSNSVGTTIDTFLDCILDIKMK